MSSRLAGKTIVITGASAGIGAATAVACGREGMNVVVSARRRDRLETVAAEVRDAGGQAQVVVCDVQREEDVARLIEQTVQAFGHLDIMFANAGYGLFSSVEHLTDTQARDIFETNFFGTLRCVQAAIPVMREQGGGHLVVCSSSVAEVGIPMYGIYAATKAAQDAVCSAMRAELRPAGIDVTGVYPIGTQSEFFDVARRRATDSSVPFNSPSSQPHTAQRVAKAIVKALKRPVPEVWPSVGARLGIAFCNAFPRLHAWAMRNLYERRFRKLDVSPMSQQHGDDKGDVLPAIEPRRS